MFRNILNVLPHHHVQLVGEPEKLICDAIRIGFPIHRIALLLWYAWVNASLPREKVNRKINVKMPKYILQYRKLRCAPLRIHIYSVQIYGSRVVLLYVYYIIYTTPFQPTHSYTFPPLSSLTVVARCGKCYYYFRPIWTLRNRFDRCLHAHTQIVTEWPENEITFAQINTWIPKNK